MQGQYIILMNMLTACSMFMMCMINWFSCRKRSDWKKGKNGKITKNKEKRRAKIESCGDVANLSGPPEVELPSNASSFAIFASVRLAVLERWMKQACQIYLASSSSSPPVDGSSEIESDSEENTDKTREIPPLRVPKV